MEWKREPAERFVGGAEWSEVQTAEIVGVRFPPAAAVCDFVSAGPVSLANVAGAAKSQSDA